MKSLENRIKQLEESHGCSSQLLELLRMVKTEYGDDSPTPRDIDDEECLRQIAEFLPA